MYCMYICAYNACMHTRIHVHTKSRFLFNFCCNTSKSTTLRAFILSGLESDQGFPYNSFSHMLYKILHKSCLPCWHLYYIPSFVRHKKNKAIVSQKICGDYHLRAKSCPWHIPLLSFLPPF